MKLKPWWDQHRSAGAVGAGLAVLLGAILNFSRLGQGLTHLSYDLPHLLSRSKPSSELVIIRVDEELVQSAKGPLLDRSLLARLVRHLYTNEARLIVLDVVLDLPGLPSADEELAEAIKAHGNVVLAAVEEDKRRMLPTGKVLTIHAMARLPDDRFLAAAATNWGFCDLNLDSDSAVRRHYAGTDLYPSLPWKAARLSGATATRNEEDRWLPRWLHYYGKEGIFPTLSCSEALSRSKDSFADKVVFIGKGQRTPFVDDEPDEFRTPFTTWNGQSAAGVELLATTFLNLRHGDWLSRLPQFTEFLLLLACGAGFGFGLALCRPAMAAGIAAAGVLGVGLGAVLLVWQSHHWFAWAIVVAAQIPCALGWSVLSYSRATGREKDKLLADARRLSREKRKPEKALSKTLKFDADALPVSSAGQAGADRVRHFELLKRIGAGAYGEVWLARNAVGMYQAVKLIYRDKVGSEDGYEREFNGIRSFMPISLDHPGLLRVLHVGRNDEAGFYYYVMELADDETRGQKFDPAAYVPRSLAKDLKERGRMRLRDCVDLGLLLVQALEYLHSRQLVHRDIKPGNIVFVNGLPKLADIGLVTEADRSDMSFVGTPGFMVPALHGTPAGDLASLGRVLYVSATGRGPQAFPDMPPDLESKAKSRAFSQFTTILSRAAQLKSFPPYASAKEMETDLLRLQTEISLEQNASRFRLGAHR